LEVIGSLKIKSLKVENGSWKLKKEVTGI